MAYQGREIVIDLNNAGLQELIRTKVSPPEGVERNIVVVKLSATWCGPCNRCKDHCEEWFTKMPENVLIYDLDVDDNIELYATLKQKRMVHGIPAILAWYPDSDHDHDPWYVPDDIVNDSALPGISSFFQRVLERSREELN